MSIPQATQITATTANVAGLSVTGNAAVGGSLTAASLMIGALSISGNIRCNVVTFTSNGTYTKPNNLLFAIVEVQGPGGGAGSMGGVASNMAWSDGAGGGGYSIKTYNASDLSSTESVGVGTGGARGASAGNKGSDGAFASTFKSIVAGPGSGSFQFSPGTAAASGNGTTGGTASGGDINIPGQPGLPGIRLSGTAGHSGIGGASVLGFSGRVVNANSGGNSGTGYGSGGSGGANFTSGDILGANGMSGIVIITEVLMV